jgi:hypothetical protein
MYIWKIIIRYAGTKKIIKLRGKPGDSNTYVFEKAKAYAKKLKEADTDSSTKIDLVSGTKAYPPRRGVVIPRGHKWCPYCVQPRIFIENKTLGVKKCQVCGISDSDFYYKKYNHSW